MGRYTSVDSLVGVRKDGNCIWLSFPARLGCLAWGLSQPGFPSQVYHTLGEDRVILSLMILMLRSDHCSVNIGEGVVVTGNYPEVNTVNM